MASMNYKFYRTALIILISLFWTSCYYSGKSWDTIYAEQENFFNANRQTFESAVSNLQAANIRDTTLIISDKYLSLTDSQITALKKLDISIIDVRKYSCPTKMVRFIPDKLSSDPSPWSADEFFMLEIIFDKCDDRNRKGYHWKMEGSEHKHSFGQGDGWFIYSDTDFL